MVPRMVQGSFGAPGAAMLGSPAFRPDERAVLMDRIAEALGGTGEVWLLTGPRGSGRTTLLDGAIAGLPGPPTRMVRVAADPGQAGLSLREFVARVAGPGAQAGYALEQAFELLTGDDPPVLVIDGADGLAPEVLRYIQLASKSAPGLQVFLVALPGFRAVLDRDEFAHLRSRLGPELAVPPLSEQPPAQASGQPAAGAISHPTPRRAEGASAPIAAPPARLAPPRPGPRRQVGALAALILLAAGGLGAWAVLTTPRIADAPAKPPSPRADQASPAAAPVPPAQEAALPAPPATQPVPPELTAALLDRGEAMLAIGDVSAARLLFERAAAGGSAPALRAAGQAYDPAVLSRLGAVGIRPDAARAVAFYDKAAALGDAEAHRLLVLLKAREARR